MQIALLRSNESHQGVFGSAPAIQGNAVNKPIQNGKNI
jgi:hypothetical protein